MAPLNSGSTIEDLLACAKQGTCKVNIHDSECYSKSIDGPDFEVLKNTCAARNKYVCSSSQAYAFSGQAITGTKYDSLKKQLTDFNNTSTEGMTRDQLRNTLNQKITDSELRQKCMDDVLQKGLAKCEDPLSIGKCAYQPSTRFTVQESKDTASFEINGITIVCSTKDSSALLQKACQKG